MNSEYLPNSPRARGEIAALSEPQPRTRVRRLSDNRERDNLMTPCELTFEQTELCEQWRGMRALMNDAAARGEIYLADEYLTRLRAIEQQLPFNPERMLTPTPQETQS